MSIPIERQQLEKAVKALLIHEENQKNRQAKEGLPMDLLEEQQYFLLVLSTKRVPEKGSLKPHRIPLKHTIRPEDKVDVCLFTKDPQSEYKELLREKGVTSISKVVGVSKLHAKFKAFESKRQLCGAYEFFLADDRIIPMLPKKLGKTFFNKKKHPIAVNMKKQDLAKEISQAIHSTYFYVQSGSCSAIKIATTDQSQLQIVENIVNALPEIIAHVPKKWKNIKSIHLKTSSSISLPLYTSLPDAPQLIDIGVESESLIEEANTEPVAVVPSSSVSKASSPVPASNVSSLKKRKRVRSKATSSATVTKKAK